MRKTTLIQSAAISIFLSCFALAADQPWPEHPRPDLQRAGWISLNGEWSFEFDPKDVGVGEVWFKPHTHTFDRRIIVPFPWESKLSRVENTDYRGVAWYAREFTMPAGGAWKDKDAWLVIGACDFEAKVWVNGKVAGEHVGGYLPFELNMTPLAKPGEAVTVVIRVVDNSDPQQPGGKQIGWYTRTSGIWQSIYLEARGARFIPRLRFFPNVRSGEVGCEVAVSEPEGGTTVTLSSPEQAFEPVSAVFREHQPIAALKIKLNKPEPWTPDTPKLYRAVLELSGSNGQPFDRLETYFGLREISIEKAPGREYRYICLNGKPVYLRGALHQSFHPAGIYQYPDDATVRSDYEKCKELGINMLRIHIKVPVPRELYWADKLGVLIMQDMPNFGKYTEQAQAWWQETLIGAMARDFNHPSIFAWVDFNETWGIGDGGYTPAHQDWVAGMYKLTKQIDPSRPVEDNSPCYYDHVVTDINSWHFYLNEYDAAKRHVNEVVEKTQPGSSFNFVQGRTQGDQPLMNSEYGGIGAGSGDQDISWCFKFLTNELRLQDKICGYVYTELSDIEWEHNGFVNYDRTPKEYGYEFWFPGMTMKHLNGADFVALDAPPCVQLKAGSAAEIPVKISHWSQGAGEGAALRWRIDWMGPMGKRVMGEWQTRPAAWKSYAVTPQDAIRVQADAAGETRLGALLVELVDGKEVLARNYVNLLVERPASPRVQRLDDKHVAVRFDPADFAEWEWKDDVSPLATGVASEKVSGLRSGHTTYELQLPFGLNGLESAELVAELSSKATWQKLDWPARKTPLDYPQTDARKYSSDLTVSIGGQEPEYELLVDDLGGNFARTKSPATLPDDPADARGVLTHVRNYQPGSYGYLWRFRLDGEKAAKLAQSPGPVAIRFEVKDDARNRGGLAIFGDGLGRFCMDPTLILTFKEPVKFAAEHSPDKSVTVHRMMDRRVALISTAEQGGTTWRYTTKQPGPKWMQPDFDDGQFLSGKGGFGTPGTPNAIVGKRWKTPDIWMRTTVQLPDRRTIKSGVWRIYHDEDIEIYVNGQEVFKETGFVNSYVDVPLDGKTMEALREGDNIIAVHCHQTGGGQNVDVGLIAVRQESTSQPAR